MPADLSRVRVKIFLPRVNTYVCRFRGNGKAESDQWLRLRQTTAEVIFLAFLSGSHFFSLS
jgi:hypothetical protein